MDHDYQVYAAEAADLPARVRVRLALRAIEDDARLDDLTDSEVDSIIAAAAPPPPAGSDGDDVEYEVWQQDAFGDGDAMVAGSTALADAQHYAAVYGQDGPAWVVEVRRRRLPTPPVAPRG